MIESGIYFNLDADAYHADPALGSTSLKAIALDPVEFQYSRLIGEEKDTAALLWGSALHTRTLEGRTAFKTRHPVAPDKKNYPGALVLMEDLRRHAASMGLKGGKTKAEVASLIREHDQSVVIWDEIDDAFRKMTEGKRVIPATIAAEIEQAAEWMQAYDKLSPVMTDGTFRAGASEVSIFYEDDGVRLKCRIDHLLPASIVDLKSFRPAPGWNTRANVLDKIIGRVIAQQRYDLQCAAYIRGWLKAKPLYEAGLVFDASEREREILKAAMARPSLKWTWVLVKNAGAPVPFVYEFDLASFSYKGAIDEIEDAINAYRSLRKEFGEDKQWLPRHPAGVLDDMAMPAWLGM